MVDILFKHAFHWFSLFLPKNSLITFCCLVIVLLLSFFDFHFDFTVIFKTYRSSEEKMVENVEIVQAVAA